MKLLAPLSFIKASVKVLFVTHGYYKIILHDKIRDYTIESFTSNSFAYDRIVLDSCKSDYSRGSGYYTLRQAYVSILTNRQITLLNKLYYEAKSKS